MVEKRCKPLQRGNSKPWYKDLKQTNSISDYIMKLVNPQGETIVEASQCAEILNKYFKDQFWEGQQISETIKLDTNDADQQRWLLKVLSIVYQIVNVQVLIESANRIYMLMTRCPLCKYIFQTSFDFGKLNKYI